WAAMDYGNCYKIAESIEQLNPIRNHLEQQISFSAKEFHAPETRTVAHVLFLVKNLIAIGDINFKIRDKTLAVEFFKKAWIIGNEYLIAKIENHLIGGVIDITMKELENVLKKTSPETLLKKQLSCSLITSRGIDKEGADKTVAMKLIMHDYIIEPCIKRTEAKNWSGGFGKKWGLCTYVEPTYIKKILSHKRYKDPTGIYGMKEVTEADILKAQMLCFREICLAEHISQKANLTCLTQFIAKYPNVVKTTLKLHPEYCIDSKIVLATKGILALHTSVADIPLITSIEISLDEQVELGGNAEEFKE
ncbi:hypothetical protein N9N97_01860, partial [Rickettsiaceae bacterium]|nr:hypothetical protein [Rickettsiaceae bacterium]